jgi:hypothetical protein
MWSKSLKKKAKKTEKIHLKNSKKQYDLHTFMNAPSDKGAAKGSRFQNNLDKNYDKKTYNN